MMYARVRYRRRMIRRQAIWENGGGDVEGRMISPSAKREFRT